MPRIDMSAYCDGCCQLHPCECDAADEVCKTTPNPVASKQVTNPSISATRGIHMATCGYGRRDDDSWPGM